MHVRTPVLAAVALCAFALPALSAANEGQTIKLVTSTGESAGTATLRQSKGALDLKVKVVGLAPGVHGIHVHENATCTMPDFKSAGAHFDPMGHQHVNLTVGEDGTATFAWQLAGLSIGTGQPNDVLLHGVSLVIHANPDDMKTDPTGNAGARIACGPLPAVLPAAQ